MDVPETMCAWPRWLSSSAIFDSKNWAIERGVVVFVVESIDEQTTDASKHREHDGNAPSQWTFLSLHLAQAMALRRTRADILVLIMQLVLMIR